MKKFFVFFLCLICIFTISCEDKLKESTPEDGLLTNKLTKKEMKRDLDYFEDFVIKNHYDYSYSISEKDFYNEISRIRDEIDNYTSDQFAFELIKLSAKLSNYNAFASLDSSRKINRNYLPFDVKKFKEGYFITEIEEEHKEYLGSKLLKIGSTSIEDVVLKLSEYYGAETDSSKQHQALSSIVFWDMLYDAKIVDSKNIDITVEYQGKEVVLPLKAYRNLDYSSKKFVNDGIVLPSDKASNSDYYDFELIDNYIYLKINVCYDQENKPVNAFVAQLNEFMNVAVYKNVVVDMRSCFGDDYTSIYPIIGALRAFYNAGGRVYCLIGTGTQCGAVVNIRTNLSTFAQIVGTETGGTANYYGTNRGFTLPNSLVRVTVPTKNHNFYENEGMLTYKPSVEAELSYADYIKGIDSVINLALRLKHNEK